MSRPRSILIISLTAVVFAGGLWAVLMASIASALTGDDDAPRYIYIPADPYSQKRDDLDANHLPEIYVQMKWRSDQSMTWWSSDATLTTQIQDAIGRWETYLPGFDWATNPESDQNKDNAAVWFELKTDCPRVGSPGDFDITIQTGSADTTRRANYVTLTKICVDNAQAYSSSTTRRRILLHEMGHAYGLNERYYDNGQCNDRESTVMDTIMLAGTSRWGK